MSFFSRLWLSVGLCKTNVKFGLLDEANAFGNEQYVVANKMVQEGWTHLDDGIQEARLKIKTIFPSYGDSHDKTVTRPSHL